MERQKSEEVKGSPTPRSSRSIVSPAIERLGVPMRPVSLQHGTRCLFALWALLTLAACDPSLSATLPSDYLGRWYYTGSGGGISGSGLGDEATGYVVIHSDNTMDLFEEDDTLVRTMEFTVSRGESIFSTEDRWLVRFDRGEPEVIELSEDGQTMSLNQNAYDGIGRGYARSRE